MVNHAAFTDFRPFSQPHTQVLTAKTSWDILKDEPAQSLMDLFNNLQEIPMLQTGETRGTLIDFNTAPPLKVQQEV